MFGYIARRLAFGAVTIVGVSIVVFVVMRILPGDPLVAIFGPEGFTKLSDAERANYMAELGLSDPLLVQYFNWVKDIARGDFGRSFFRAESVADMILRRGPLTAEIACHLGRPVLGRRHPGGHRQRAAAQQPRRQHREVLQHPVPRRARASGSAC